MPNAATMRSTRDTEPPPPTAGELIDGQYDVEQPLGNSGMGHVLRVRDVISGERLALKLVRPELLNSSAQRHAYHTQIERCRLLVHPHIVRIISAGHDARRDAHYFTMELVDGVTLRHALAKSLAADAALTPADFNTVADGLCAALAFAHRNTVHGDLRPENVLIERGAGTPKIMNFGISRLLGWPRGGPTLAAVGSEHYAAPEVLTGAAPDALSDLFSLGVVLYELLTGRLPALRGTPRATPYPLPHALETTLSRATAVRREDRFASAEALRAALPPVG